jgi:hypothetical protein
MLRLACPPEAETAAPYEFSPAELADYSGFIENQYHSCPE